MPVPNVPSSNHHWNPHSLILNAPYRLQLLADGQPYDMLTFDTREQLKEVMAFVDAMKERTRERNERTRTANLEDLPTLHGSSLVSLPRHSFLIRHNLHAMV